MTIYKKNEKINYAITKLQRNLYKDISGQSVFNTTWLVVQRFGMKRLVYYILSIKQNQRNQGPNKFGIFVDHLVQKGFECRATQSRKRDKIDSRLESLAREKK